MTVYIDINDDYKIYPSDDSGELLPYKTSFFDGKCDTFIKGYRCVPTGYTWMREDGEVFIGEMIAPLVDYVILEKAQLEYELEQVKAENTIMKDALAELGVTEDDQLA